MWIANGKTLAGGGGRAEWGKHTKSQPVSPSPSCPVAMGITWIKSSFKKPLSLPASLGGSDGKESAWNTGDWGLILGWGRSPGEENGNPLHYSCLEDPLDRGTWWAPVRGVTKDQSGFHFSLPVGWESQRVMPPPACNWINSLHFLQVFQFYDILCIY